MSHARGFTLVEVLVALAVLAVGLLGAVLMLLGSLRGQADAQREVAATQLLGDVADRIRIGVVDRAEFAARARALDPGAAATIESLPTAGLEPERYRVSLRFSGDTATLDHDVVLFHAPMRAPAAG